MGTFTVCAHNKDSHTKVCESLPTTSGYFEHFPLFSTKFLNYKDWKEVHFLQRDYEHKVGYSLYYFKRCREIKSQFNAKRLNFDWSHLLHFY
jgi:hypothetical protein